MSDLLRRPGFKRFFAPAASDSAPLHVNGIGVREAMAPCMVERPHGTGDYLLMLFHDAAVAGTKPCEGPCFPPGTMMIWPPGKGQFYGNRAAPFTHSWIHFQGRKIASILKGSGLPLLRPFPVADPSRFLQSLLDVHRELVSYTQPDEAIVGGLLEIGFRELARGLEGSSRDIRIPENFLVVHRLISGSPSQKITLGEMAKAAGMSPHYFCARFKGYFGISPVGYLIQQRLRGAAHLLSDRNLSISQIAAQVGYEDLFHFSKAFRKQFGLSPRKLRERPQ